MDQEDLRLFRGRELERLLYYLHDTQSRGVLLVGDRATGKTTLLHMVEEELKGQGRAVLFVDMSRLAYRGELSAQLLEAALAAFLFREADDSRRTIRTSGGDPPLDEVAAILRDVSIRMESPVLMFDALDKSLDPLRMGAAVEELSITLDGWKFVVSSSPSGIAEIRRFARFDVVELRGITDADTFALLREYAPGLPDEVVSRITTLTSGNLLLLRLIARALQHPGSLTAASHITSLESGLKGLVDGAIEASSDPPQLSEILEELALVGGRERTSALASRLRIADEDIWRLLDTPYVHILLVLDDSARTAAFFHDAIRDLIVSHRILDRPFRLTDLNFGAEEAERDELLDKSFVRRPGMEDILDMRRSIIIGDRGSGKSAIFRKLSANTSAADDRHILEIYPVTNTSDLLHRVVANDTWMDAEALRAAWLVVVASQIALAVPGSASKRIRRNAADIRAAFGLPNERPSFVRRALLSSSRILGGTTLKFAVGPVNLEAQLPSGSDGRPGKTPVDIESFLQETDGLLRESGHRAVVMFDRIDETFKYDRPKQEAMVQALLQAERHVVSFEAIGLVVFLRTDLYELYDIQEKNKLVSSTLRLDWHEEEEWLQVLARHVLANQPFQRLAKRLHVAGDTIETRSALEVLFPREIEGQPVDRWLIDSLRNGNGQVSPRLAVLLLYLTRDLSTRPEDLVSMLPLFSADSVGKAMTKLSDLSFSEVVNDFKVAPSFVRNCRAGKLDTFALREVENLFNEAEGKKSEQVDLLERLGFLERVVQKSSSGVESLFRIPKLYTRCWDYA